AGRRGQLSCPDRARFPLPGADDVRDVERDLVVGRQLCWSEPGKLRDVVVGPRLACDHSRRPVQVQRPRSLLTVAVAIHPGADELERLDLETRLLAELAAKRVERVLALLEEASGQVPLSPLGLDRPPSEQEATGAIGDEGAGGRVRMRVRL